MFTNLLTKLLFGAITGHQFSFISAIVAAASAVMGGEADKEAARTTAETRDLGTRESARQFDITQAQAAPFREAGLRGLQEYASRIGDYDADITNDLPDAFISNRDLPSFTFDSGDYSNVIQSDIPGNFRYDYENDPSRANRIQGGMDALTSRGVQYQGDQSAMGSNLATRGFSKDRSNAFEDYGIRVARERDTYGRSVDDYSRKIGREQELYGRGRQNYQDRVRRESAMEDRRFTDYQSQIAQEEEMRRRDLEAYGRNYVDPLNRYSQLAGLGQSTTTGLGALRESYANTISQNAREAGRARAAGVIGQTNAYAQGARGIAEYYGERYG